jgi:hydrogenase maturation protein HypF
MALEGLAGEHLHSGMASDDPYPFPLKEGPPWIADWGPMMKVILEERDRGVPASRIAFRFHRSLAELIVAAAHTASLPDVALVGGCFQNAILLSLAQRRLEEEGFRVHVPQKLPPNDGGISLGQLWVAGLIHASGESAW